MEDNEAKVIDEAIKYIQSVRYTGGHGEPSTPLPYELEKAVKEYLADNGETLESY